MVKSEHLHRNFFPLCPQNLLLKLKFFNKTTLIYKFFFSFSQAILVKVAYKQIKGAYKLPKNLTKPSSIF